MLSLLQDLCPFMVDMAYVLLCILSVFDVMYMHIEISLGVCVLDVWVSFVDGGWARRLDGGEIAR